MKNATYHSKTKHIQRRYHWLWERVQDKDFSLTKIDMEENGFDMPTKVLSADKMGVCLRRIGLTKNLIPE